MKHTTFPTKVFWEYCTSLGFMGIRNEQMYADCKIADINYCHKCIMTKQEDRNSLLHVVVYSKKYGLDPTVVKKSIGSILCDRVHS